MLNIANPQRNADQNHKELSPHTCQEGYIIKKTMSKKCLGEDVEEREPSCMLGGSVNWCSHYGEQYKVFSKH